MVAMLNRYVIPRSTGSPSWLSFWRGLLPPFAVVMVIAAFAWWFRWATYPVWCNPSNDPIQGEIAPICGGSRAVREQSR